MSLLRAQPGIIKPAAPAGWNPADYGTVVFWANETSAITGTTNVTQWNDISGAGNHAVAQGAGVRDSTVKTINGKRVIRCTTAANGMSCGSAVVTSPGTCLFCFTLSEIAARGLMGNMPNISSGNNGWCATTRAPTNSDTLSGAAAGSGYAWVTGTAADSDLLVDEVVIMMMAWDNATAANVRLRRNSSSYNTTAALTAANLPTSTTAPRFGGLASSVFPGDMCEAVLWTTRLSVANMDAAAAAVASRWGVTPP